MRRRLALAAIAIVAIAVFGAGFFAPYDEAAQNRTRPLEPPSRIHFMWPGGTIGRPFVIHEGRAAPIRFFHNGRLFGVDEPARIFLLGTDEYGRDQFSRLLYGGRLSLAAGIFAAALTLAVGLVAGCLAGFYGGWTDQLLMRGAELFLAVPWIYLLLAVRAALPLSLSPGGALLMLVAVTGTAGWPRPARLVRGIVLSARERPYVYVARSFGAPDRYLIARHILPEVYGVIATQASLLIPQFILADVTLSFLGLGAGEPAATWGGMLAAVRHINVLESHWGMLAPVFLLVPVISCFLILADFQRTDAAIRVDW